VTQPISDDEACARAWVDIDLAALVANARRVGSVAGVPLMPMVKANGYGLGAARVAHALEAVSPWGFGVATVEEGAELRAAGVTRPVVVFTPLLPGSIAQSIRHGLRPAIGDITALAAWMAAAPGQPFHLEIDSGMARAGIRYDDGDALAALRPMLKAADGAWEGVFSHFHSADSDPAATERQWLRFQHVLAALGRRPTFVHAANSAAAMVGDRYAADLVRPGVFLYGGAAGEATPAPVASVRARVVAVRQLMAGESVSYAGTWMASAPVTIATLAIGYADGLLRSLGNRGAVEIGGVRAPIRGRVTMDMTMIEAPASTEVGDVATLFGGMISLDEQAAAAGTIAYELLTALGPRVRRRYGRS
jgi:alanine racemase